jgi:hypothetical protein
MSSRFCIVWISSCVAPSVAPMQTIVIEVSGGVVQQVYCDDELRVIKIDWDVGESPGDAFHTGDLVVQPFATFPKGTRNALREKLE